MDRLVREWIGVAVVATAAGMVDLRLGLLVAGLWLVFDANFGDDSGDDDAGTG